MNLNSFNITTLFEAATNLFQQLGIKLNSNTAEPLPVKELLKQHYKDNEVFNSIKSNYFIGIIDDSVFQATGMFDINYSIKDALQQGDKSYDGLMLFALELSKKPTRTEISEITRAFNRVSQKMPVALLLKYSIENEAIISIAISERFKYVQNWRQGEKAGKVIILRDIHTKPENTHAGHERILLDLVKPVGVNNYDQLHQHWLQVLDVNILNKKFFQDLANWYFWAMENVSFPDDLEKKKDVRNATNLIRLITRVVFIWFIKEKSLVPNALFNKAHLDKILKDFNKNKKSHNYYHAILQNLFFGTLNQKMDERKFVKEGNIKTNKDEYGVKNLFRYADLFTISEKEAMQLFKEVPFLNGGLFDCLDKPNEENKIVYVDGFSRNTKKQAIVPDYIFFGEEREVDHNEIYGTKNKKYKAGGLINLLESYKFTIAENTPIEEEIALDPELLGKVFENLLASYNPETQTTARKQTGSFYTPREIVNYMVDESLLEYIKQNVKTENNDFETRLRELISYAETPNPFDEAETKALIEGINNCKILDPACGSGAYPMGILHKMVHLLQKLDPENIHWKALQRQKAMEETEAAFKIGDKEERGKRLAEIIDVFENNASDYGRKLYLIENCIYGIDIQPIAVQISKLRFFISLIIDQNKQATKENFGIRSLPNLETKFVAANTLIGLDKPAQTQLRNPQIEEKETELKELRHKYFTANTRKEKLQYQKQDKKLRQEIAKMLESDGWQTEVAKQIVAFDPYDQNTFAPWFDPEWMFGLTSGFDIVIGNPPFVNIKGQNNETKDALRNKYKYSRGADIYVAFIEKSLQLNKLAGNLFFIVPNKFFGADYGKSIREYLKTGNINILSIWDLKDEKVFENAMISTIVIGFKKDKKSEFTKLIQGATTRLVENLFDVEGKIQIEANDEDNLILAKLRLNENLLSVADIRTGVMGFEYWKMEPIIHNKINKNCVRLYTNGNLSKYSDKWENANIKLYKDEYFQPSIELNKDYLNSNTIELFKHRPKIIVRGVSKEIAAIIDNYGSGLLVAVHSIIPRKINIYYLLGLLNSRLINWFHLNTIYSIRIPEGSLKYPTSFFETIPIAIGTTTLCKKIETLVVTILEIKKSDVDADISDLEKQIDQLVYKLYDLTYDEVKIIEPNFWLSEAEYNAIKVERDNSEMKVSLKEKANKIKEPEILDVAPSKKRGRHAANIKLNPIDWDISEGDKED